MKRIYSQVVMVTCAAGLGLAGCGSKQNIASPAPAAPPVVRVVEAKQTDVPIFSEAIATLDGLVNTPIHAQVSGYLIRQAYQEGAVVKPGDLLFQLDPKPFQADLDRATANLAHQRALSQAPVEAAQASLTTAKINLGDTKITSPIAGVAARALPGLGDWIRPGMTLTTVSTVDPIQAHFTLPRQSYLNDADRIAKLLQIPLPDRPEAIELILADGTRYPNRGRFFHTDRPIQKAEGTITVCALFSNPDRVLRPGQYAKVRGGTWRIKGAVMIPERCVNRLQDISRVMVVRPDNTIEVRDVTTGDLAGSLRSITSGLRAGERVVVEGIDKCREGMPVTPEALVDPAPDAPPAAALPPP